MIRRTTIRFGVAIAAIPLLAACGDTAEMDLCTQYADLVTAAEQLQQQDPESSLALVIKALKLRRQFSNGHLAIVEGA